jgi:tetratricopeptide (TPR) repeat protein
LVTQVSDGNYCSSETGGEDCVTKGEMPSRHYPVGSHDNCLDPARTRQFRRQHRLEEASSEYEIRIDRDPGDLQALYCLGQVRKEQGETLEAHEVLTKALGQCDASIICAPPTAKLFETRGLILYALERFFEALVSFDRAIGLEPNCSEAHARRGITLFQLHHHRAAIASFEKALRLEPTNRDAAIYRGRALRKLNKYTESLAVYDDVLAVDPNSALAHNYRGETLASLGRYDEAVIHFHRAIQSDADFVPPHWNVAVMHLLRGDFARGWQGYECRWEKKSGVDLRKFQAPLWLGRQSIAGKTILLHAEQGFGDTIQFVRYVNLVVERGGRVFLEVQAELASLMSRMDGPAAVFAQPKLRTEQSRIDGQPILLAADKDFPAFDYHCPLLSLPLAFKTMLDNVPAQIPYLRADPERVTRWQHRLHRSSAPCIGIVWSGNPFHADDRNRSIALGRLMPVLTEPFEFVSLQKSVSDADAELLATRPSIRHFGKDLEDFDDTAALIAQMDLVITVDTAVAHLAGAMAKPVWLLLAYSPEWRWMLDRDSSLWYPNMRLFRQSRLHDWDEVIGRVRDELARWTGTPRGDVIGVESQV